MSLNPFLTFLRTHAYVLKGRLHFPKNRVGEAVAMKNGQEFVVFRQVIVDPTSQQPDNPGAVLRVQFRFARMSPSVNKVLSLLPIPFIVGLNGFRSKTWLIDPISGEFQGVYQWDTAKDAENYRNAFALKMMTKRAIRSSVTFEIIA